MKPNAVIIPSCGSNLASLQFALERLGADVPLTEDPARIRAASHVILPGVGAAAPGMERLAAAGLVDLIPTLTQPVLGICLGMQLLFARSEEEETRCLGVIDAEVRRFPASPDLPGAADGLERARARRRVAAAGRRAARAPTPTSCTAMRRRRGPTRAP